MEGLSLRNVIKKYDESKDIYALNNVSLNIGKGEFVAIVGKSGSGKSTLLNMISGIDRPSEGEVIFDNIQLSNQTEAYLTKWRGQNIGIVFQFFQLIPTLTVLKNVCLAMEFVGKIPRKQREKSAIGLLELVDVADLRNKYPAELSGGEQQRVAIARALANNPGYLIADEPTGNLDSANAEQVIKLFHDIVQAGTTVVMVTHSNELAEYAERIITVSDGELLGERKGTK